MRRILDISESPAQLRVEYGCLCVETTNAPVVRIPACEIAVVVLGHPQISCTQAVLSELAAAGGVLVTCDAKRLPVGLQLPLQSHFVQGERFLAQAQVKLPVRKRLWQEIVRAKIRLQGSVLHNGRISKEIQRSGQRCRIRSKVLPQGRFRKASVSPAGLLTDALTGEEINLSTLAMLSPPKQTCRKARKRKGG